MLVRATDKYEKLNLQDNVLGRIPKKGEEFEVSEERYNVLTKTNSFKVVFVEKVEEIKDTIETATKNVKTEKAVKRTARKVKSIEVDLDKGTIKNNYDI